MVCHNSETALVVKMKSKKHLDTLLMELNEKVLSKAKKSFSQGEDRVLIHKVTFCVPDRDGLRKLIRTEAHCSRYSIHQVSQRCMETNEKLIGGMI